MSPLDISLSRWRLYASAAPVVFRTGPVKMVCENTLDASSTADWRAFAFARRSTVSPAGAWDLAFRRFHVIAAPGAGLQDLGAVPFESVAVVPEHGYLGNVADPDTTNPGVDDISVCHICRVGAGAGSDRHLRGAGISRLQTHT